MSWLAWRKRRGRKWSVASSGAPAARSGNLFGFGKGGGTESARPGVRG